MDKIISCEFNIDTACVEVKYADGSMISIDCTRVEYSAHPEPGIRCLRATIPVVQSQYSGL